MTVADFDDLFDELERYRDEINLKMHLASMDMKDEWQELEQKWDRFSAQARVSDSADSIGDALDQLGGELKMAYGRFRDALKD
jgi:hypothetical protein